MTEPNRRPAGRPHRTVRATPRRPGWYGCENRIAWMLRANRLLGPDARLARLASFAEVFPDSDWHGPVSASRISRWETASVRADYRVLRRYEQLLGLPTHRLVATADWVYRVATRESGTQILVRDLPTDDVAARHALTILLDRALGGDLLTGMDWDRLTTLLAAQPAAFLYPAAAWTDLAHRLLTEMFISADLAWLQRAEALRVLIQHPQARPHLVAVCGDLAADKASQAVIEPLAVLDLTADPEANRRILAELANPASERALRGALIAAAHKVARRHFTSAQLAALATAAADLLTQPGLGAETHTLLSHLIHQLPRHQLTRLADHLGRVTAKTFPPAHGEPDQGPTSPQARSVNRLAVHVTAQLPQTPDGPHSILPSLLADLLLSPDINDRLAAAMLIAATPYGPAVGHVLADELAAHRHHDADSTVAIVSALGMLSDSTGRGPVERLILDPTTPPAVAETACWTVGHLGGGAGPRFWRDAIARTKATWQHTGSAVSLSALRGLVYGLGIGRHRPLLHAAERDPTLPDPVRSAARSWTSLPAYVTASNGVH